MKVQKTSVSFNSKINFKSSENISVSNHIVPSEKPDKINDLITSRNLFFGAAAVGVIALSSASLVSGKKASKMNSVKKAVASSVSDVLDLNYKNKIITALDTKFGIKANIDSLASIVGPEEFKKLIPLYKKQDFMRSSSKILDSFKNYDDYKYYLKSVPYKEIKEFYKPLINGDFRVSLHTHSNFSDGVASVSEFLDCASKYADKVALKNKKDSLPPFMIALTDHDNLDGCVEAFKIIAQNPEKFKNLKFVAGAEFSVKSKFAEHDVTGLCLNPFDEKLTDMLDKLKDNRQKVVQKFLDKEPLFNSRKITLDDLIAKEKEHKSKISLTNRSGKVYIRHALDFYSEITGRDVQDAKNKLDGKSILSVEKVIGAVKDSGGFTSLTHPIKSFWKYIGDENLDYLKHLGLDGIETYHQYTPSKYFKLKSINSSSKKSYTDLFDEITSQYVKYAQKNNLFLSGGTDSHKSQIFSRQPKISSELLNEILN